MCEAHPSPVQISVSAWEILQVSKLTAVVETALLYFEGGASTQAESRDPVAFSVAAR